MNSLYFMDATTQTVRGAVQYLSRNGAKVGLTGFVGGAVTMIGATKIPELGRRASPSTASRPSRPRRPGTSAFRCKGTSPTRTTRCTPQLVDTFEKAAKGGLEGCRVLPL